MHTTLAYLHHIHGLGEFFLFMNDDQLLVNPFELRTLLDASSGQMLAHLPTKAGKRPGWTNFSQRLEVQFGKRARKLDMHCPFMCKRCLLEEIEATLADEYVCDPSMKAPVCELNFHFNSFVQNYAIDRKAAQSVESSRIRCVEVHTLAKQKQSSLQRRLESAPLRMQWINLQGPGVSDEYAKIANLRETVDDFYYKSFPNKSRFELVDYMPN